MNIHEIIFHTWTMHQPTRQLVHWHMFTNQQKLCTNRYIVMYANHISDKIFQKIKKKKNKKNNYVHLLEIFCENFWPESMSRDTYIPLQNLLVSLKSSTKLSPRRKKSKTWWKTEKHTGSTVYVYYLVTGFLYMLFNCYILYIKTWVFSLTWDNILAQKVISSSYCSLNTYRYEWWVLNLRLTQTDVDLK